LWLSRFPAAGADTYLFPAHKVGLSGNGRTAQAYGFEPSRPAGEWKKAWSVALKRAGLKYRWHDCRHTFVTRLAENPNVSEETIRALAGHVSRKMLERYSHIRVQAKQAAIAALEAGCYANIEGDSPQNPPQSRAHTVNQHLVIPEKALN
jgi:integrase